MSTTRSGALVALALTVALASCMSSDRPNSPTGIGGGGGSEDTGGSPGTGGGTSTGGNKATGGSTGTGGSSNTGGSTGGSGSTGTGGAKADAGSTGGSGGGADASTAAWLGCLEPVFSGVMPMEFCMVYEKVCTFTGASHYTSMADCMTKFHGGSSDGDACKSGHLCRAATMPAMKMADCASSGTAKCSN